MPVTFTQTSSTETGGFVMLSAVCCSVTAASPSRGTLASCLLWKTRRY
jgi:hypothetical protein